MLVEIGDKFWRPSSYGPIDYLTVTSLSRYAVMGTVMFADGESICHDYVYGLFEREWTRVTPLIEALL